MLCGTTKSHRPDRFAPLLTEIRSGLGDYWTFYEECIDGILNAAAKQQDTTAWFEQMQQLVEVFDKVWFSHDGIMFLLQDMGICAPEQQSLGEGKGAAHELAFYMDNHHHHHNNNNNNNNKDDKNMASMPVRPWTSTNPPPSLRPLLPNTPATAAWPPPRASAHCTRHDQKRQQEKKIQHVHQLVDARQNVKPFDFSATVLPELTYPENIRDFFYPRDDITLTENYQPPAPNSLRKASHNPVLFNNPTIKTNIAEHFGYVSKHHHHHARRLSYSVWQPPPALLYNPEDDDLAAWKKLLEAEREDEQNAVNGGFDTLPQWNDRFDMDFD